MWLFAWLVVCVDCLRVCSCARVCVACVLVCVIVVSVACSYVCRCLCLACVGWRDCLFVRVLVWLLVGVCLWLFVWFGFVGWLFVCCVSCVRLFVWLFVRVFVYSFV